MKVLMVCLGNICRSPIAEGILQHKADAAGLHWQVDSARHQRLSRGRGASQAIAKSGKNERGLTSVTNDHKNFWGSDFEKYDKIYAMAGDVIDEMKWIAGNQFDASKVELLMNELHPGKKRRHPRPLVWHGARLPPYLRYD